MFPVGGGGWAGRWRGPDRGLLSTWASSSPVDLGQNPKSISPDSLQEMHSLPQKDMLLHTWMEVDRILPPSPPPHIRQVDLQTVELLS